MIVRDLTLNKKLAEWAGFKWQPKTKTWLYPGEGLRLEIPSFTESLDACFTYLIPKLPDHVVSFYPTKVNPTDNITTWYTTLGLRNCAQSSGENSNAPLALCLSIAKLIDKRQPVVAKD